MLVRHTATAGARAAPELRDHAGRWSDRSAAGFEPFSNGRVYQGYADARLENWQHAYYGDAYARLRTIKSRYDPDALFAHRQSIERSPPETRTA